jgi:hypothetical protein
MKKSYARSVFSDVGFLALVRLRKQHILSLSLSLLVLAVPGAFVGAQTPSPAPEPAATLSLTKEQSNSLDKEARNLYKHCSADNGKHQDGVAHACFDLVGPLRTQLKDPASARIALRRSCSLGNQAGCNELGNDLAAGGDLTAARAAWNAPPCANGPLCKSSLFFSYAGEAPINLAVAESVGLPLCDEGKDDKICLKLKEIGSHADFAAIAQHHRDARIADIKTQIGKNNSDIDVQTGLLALAQSALNSASGFFQILTAKGEVALYQSGIKSSQKDNDKLMAELQNLQGSTDGAPSGGGLGSMLAGVAMQGVAHASDVQVSGGKLTASAFIPSSISQPQSQSAADTAGPASSQGSSGGGLYNGPNAQLVRDILKGAGSYSCAPKNPPSSIPKTFDCVRDTYVYSAQRLAWATECSAETGRPDDAVKDANLMLDTLKNAGDLCQGRATSCTTDRVISCKDLPHH